MQPAFYILLFSVAIAGAASSRDWNSNNPRVNGRYGNHDGDGVTYTYRQTHVRNSPLGTDIERESTSYTDNSIRRNNVTYSGVENVVIGHNKIGPKHEQIVEKRSWDRWDSDSDNTKSGIHLKHTESTYTDNSINLNNVNFSGARNVVVGSGNVIDGVLATESARTRPSYRSNSGGQDVEAIYENRQYRDELPNMKHAANRNVQDVADGSRYRVRTSSERRSKRGWWDVEAKYENKQYKDESHNMNHVTNRDVKNVVNGSGNHVSKRHITSIGTDFPDFNYLDDLDDAENVVSSRSKRGWVDVSAKYDNQNYVDKSHTMKHVTNRDVKNVVNGSNNTVSK